MSLAQDVGQVLKCRLGFAIGCGGILRDLRPDSVVQLVDLYVPTCFHVETKKHKTLPCEKQPRKAWVERAQHRRWRRVSMALGCFVLNAELLVLCVACVISYFQQRRMEVGLTAVLNLSRDSRAIFLFSLSNDWAMVFTSKRMLPTWPRSCSRACVLRAAHPSGVSYTVTTRHG